MSSDFFELMGWADKQDKKHRVKRKWAKNCERLQKEHPEW